MNYRAQLVELLRKGWRITKFAHDESQGVIELRRSLGVAVMLDQFSRATSMVLYWPMTDDEYTGLADLRPPVVHGVLPSNSQ